MSPKGPYKLVTVNTAPERAKKVIGKVVEEVKDQYTVIHAANCDKIDQVEAAVREHQPDVLFSASMWTPEQASEIQSIARSVKPDIKTHAIPEGFQVKYGPDATADYVKENIGKILAEMN